jgi:hypothetical protein
MPRRPVQCTCKHSVCSARPQQQQLHATARNWQCASDTSACKTPAVQPGTYLLAITLDAMRHAGPTNYMSGSVLVHTPSKPKHKKHAAHPTSPLTSRIMSAIPTVSGQPARSLSMLEDDDSDARMGEAGPHEEPEVQQPAHAGTQLPLGGAAQGPPAPSTSSVPGASGAQGNPPHAPAAATLPGTAALPGGAAVAPAADGAPPSRQATNPPTPLPDVPTTLRHPYHASFNQDVMAAGMVPVG